MGKGGSSGAGGAIAVGGGGGGGAAAGDDDADGQGLIALVGGSLGAPLAGARRQLNRCVWARVRPRAVGRWKCACATRRTRGTARVPCTARPLST